MLQRKRVFSGYVLCAVVTVTAAWLLSASAAFAAGDSNQATCPFETEATPGFQAALWELHAPPPVATDGEHVLGLDYAGFSGAENVEESGQGEYGAIYEFSRTLGVEHRIVERTFAWLHNLRRLRIRYERDPELHMAFMLLGCAVVCQRILAT
jgi:hypothetical protein